MADDSADNDGIAVVEHHRGAGGPFEGGRGIGEIALDAHHLGLDLQTQGVRLVNMGDDRQFGGDVFVLVLGVVLLAGGGVAAGDKGDVLADRDLRLFVVGGQNLRGGDDVDRRIGFIGAEHRGDIGKGHPADLNALFEHAKGKAGGQARVITADPGEQVKASRAAEAGGQQAGAVVK